MESDKEEAVTPGATFRLQEADVVIETFPDETIAVNLGNGRYYSIDLVGTETLGMLVTGHPLEAVAEHLAVRYQADRTQVEAAVTKFVSQLLDEGLVRPTQGEPPSEALLPPAPSRVAFADPSISVYSDMEDLLLLDPIHDVDETGWPVRTEATDPDAA